MLDCVIEQNAADEGGFASSGVGRSWFPAVYTTDGTELFVLGGKSLGGVSGVYAFHSDGLGRSSYGPARQIVIRDHYFGSSAAHVQFTGGLVSTAVTLDNCTFDGGGILFSSCPGSYHVSNCVFNVAGTAVSDPKGHEVEAYFTNCRFTNTGIRRVDAAGAETWEYVSLIRRYEGAAARPWSFDQCEFSTTGAATLIETRNGVMVFHSCRLVGTTASPILQRHGRIEMYDCVIEGATSSSSFGWYYLEDVFAGGVYQYTHILRDALFIVLERCTFGQPVTTYGMVLYPYNSIIIRGSGNEFYARRIDVVDNFGGSIDTLTLPDGVTTVPRFEPPDPLTGISRAITGEARTDARLVQGCFQLGPRRGQPFTLVGSGVANALVLTWNADFIEVDYASFGKTGLSAANIFMASNAGLVDYSSAPVGGYVQLYAVESFDLVSGGNIALGALTSLTVSRHGVATLCTRYDASTGTWTWVLVSST